MEEKRAATEQLLAEMGVQRADAEVQRAAATVEADKARSCYICAYICIYMYMVWVDVGRVVDLVVQRILFFSRATGGDDLCILYIYTHAQKQANAASAEAAKLEAEASGA